MTSITLKFWGAMARTKSHPVRGFVGLMSEMERIRTLGRTGFGPGPMTPPSTQSTAWVPTTDMFARGSDLVITVELAGVPASDVDVSVFDGVLTVSGARHGESEEEDDVIPFLRERYYGVFRRSLALPEGVDVQTISAEFREGLVTITVPHAAEAPASTPHRIPIQEA